jgi:two-component sensor histidine kinase
MGWRMLSSIRVRMVVLILASAVPLLILAVFVSWQAYGAALQDSREQMRVTRAAAVARHQAALAAASQMLLGLGQAPAVLDALRGRGSAACTSLLRDVRLLDTNRYAQIGVVDSGGRTLCRDGEPAAGFDAVVSGAWFASLGQEGARAVGPLQPASSGPVLPVAWRIRDLGPGGGTVLALLRVDWLTDPLGGRDVAPVVWFAGPTGALLGTGAAADLPPAQVLHRLLRRDSFASATAIGGRPFAYASAALGDGLRLVIGEAVTDGEAAARVTLLTRIGAILALVLLGLAAVVLGAQAAVVAPVRRLEAAVRSWRKGSGFDRSLTRSLPAELRDLAASVAEASDELSEREAQLRRALHQQELLMQEIHHRVKNNLQIIASLLNLQASRIRQPQARTEFESARDRVRALATLHRYLYSHGEVHTINMRNFLGELCGQLFEAMGEVAGARILLEIEAPELRMLSDQAVPLSLIVTEMVGNALKYAFPDGRRGRIGVRLTAAQDSAELVIEDDGIGLRRAETPPAAEAGPAPAAAGIGIQLIHGFVRQLRASLEIDESHGTRYVLRLPLHRERKLDQAGAAE